MELLLKRGAKGAARLNLDSAPVDVVVFDDQYEEAIEFAEELEHAGAIALPARGAIVRHWLTCPLMGLSAPIPVTHDRLLRIAGLTQHSDFEQLRAFAAGVGLHVRHEGRHVRRESGEMRHSLSCVRNDEFVAACGKAHWARQLARAMANARPVQAPLPESAAAFRAGTLTSWLLG